jgi:hypothetical protein
MTELVKCAECGLLAVLHNQTGEYVSADKRFRETGDIPHDRGRYIHNPYPFCAANIVDFRELIGGNNPDNDGSLRRKPLHEPRDCKEFTTWNPCFSPKEHKEMILSKELLQIQRERDDADREWRHKESELQRKWQAEQASIAETRHQQNLAVAIVGSKDNVRSNVIAGIIGAIAALIAAAIGAAVALHR